MNLGTLTRGIQSCLECCHCGSDNIEVKQRCQIGVSTVTEIVCHACYTGPPSPQDNPKKLLKASKYPVVLEPRFTRQFYKEKERYYQFLDFEDNVMALISCLHVGCGPNEIGLVLANNNLDADLENAYYRHIDLIKQRNDFTN